MNRGGREETGREGKQGRVREGKVEGRETREGEQREGWTLALAKMLALHIYTHTIHICIYAYIIKFSQTFS